MLRRAVILAALVLVGLVGFLNAQPSSPIKRTPLQR